ncbi:MAG: Vitamin B12 dependent methionine synthase activation subunit [Clostridia bacterium]|nr:Vitamin B12 dependent methionine synthase activation subunit [Clostridia bacterium]
MTEGVIRKSYGPPPLSEDEIFRYAGCGRPALEDRALLKSCLDEVLPLLSYRVAYRRLPLIVAGDCCDFFLFSLRSEKLSLRLQNCTEGIVFAATVGFEIDRLIAKYSRISPARGLMLQAIGSERVEALCDAFCEEMAVSEKKELTPRFSPGYGDLPLEAQRKVDSVLNLSGTVGIYLNESLLMSPSKSVTAFLGIRDQG